jgi:ribosome biogenesis protein Nip4
MNLRKKVPVNKFFSEDKPSQNRFFGDENSSSNETKEFVLTEDIKSSFKKISKSIEGDGSAILLDKNLKK